MIWAAPGNSIPLASAAGCPDVEAVFARGINEAPGCRRNRTGIRRLAAVEGRLEVLGGYTRSITLPPPTFPPRSTESETRAIMLRPWQPPAPKTKMVLGGYSQGAAVVGFVTSAPIPDGVDAADVPKPMPPDVANHVAAVTLFGTPSNRFMDTVGAPPVVIGPLYQPKTLELCAADDPVCSDGGDWAAHAAYAGDGMVDQARTMPRVNSNQPLDPALIA
jgi:cutinase